MTNKLFIIYLGKGEGIFKLFCLFVYCNNTKKNACINVILNENYGKRGVWVRELFKNEGLKKK